MKWIKYQYVCNEEEGILLTKKIVYSEANLAIAEVEAYNGEYEVVEEEGPDIIPLAIELGGTGAKTVEEARENLGLDSTIAEVKAYTDNKIAQLVNGAPETLDTLKEVSDAIAENEDVVEALNAAIGGKAPTSHTHKKSEISDFPSTMPPSAHNQAASTITAGTFAGAVVANATAVATLTTKQMRNIYLGTAELTDGTSALPAGDMYFQYETK